MALIAGTRLGPYEIAAPLGAGGMGEVHKATDTRLGRTVAIKVLPESLASNADFRARFESEAKAISSLSHPHICALYDIGQQQGIDYLVLEYLEGTTLAERLKRSKFSAVDIAKIGIQIADALKAAHSKGIVHRDIKPANIFVDAEGSVKVLDFGVAKVSTVAVASGNEMTAMTIPGDTMGTVAYMSPEQALGKPVDARSDLFSLGAVLYEMATGARAFSGDSTVEIFDAILHKEPVAVARLAPVVPAELDHIVSKALEKDPELRFQTAAEMLSELKRLNRDASSTTVTTVPARRRSGAKVWGAVAATVVVLGAATMWWFLHERSGATGASTEQVTVAVLPFQNIGAGKELDFLQVALPDEISTALSYAPGIAIRPFGNTQKFSGEGVNAQSAGKELRVSNVVTGHFLRNANELQLTLEAIDVDKNKVVWRDTFSFLAGDLKAIQDRVLIRVRQGLLPLLGVTQVGGPGTRPKNEEAYDLFLKASATPHDPTPNKQAIAMLERSVELDPNYAPAW